MNTIAPWKEVVVHALFLEVTGFAGWLVYGTCCSCLPSQKLVLWLCKHIGLPVNLNSNKS
jgi:hypothetical protein